MRAASIGTNGTYERPNVPLEMGDNVITVTALDKLRDEVTKSVAVKRIPVPIDSPRMEIVSGNDQSGQVGQELLEPIVVRLLTPAGTPIADKIVSFRVVRNKGRLATAPGTPREERQLALQLRTGADGLAGVYWTLGSDAGCGNNRVEVTSTSVAGQVVFCASATSLTARQINVGSGANQRGEVGGPAPEPLRVWVNDGCNGIGGIPVTFRVVRGDGWLDGRTLRRTRTVETSPTGHADVGFILGVTPGNNVVEADFPTNSGVPLKFFIFGVKRDETQPTSFAGLVLDNSQSPIQGATVMVILEGWTSQAVRTGIDGRFRIEDIEESGSGHLIVGGFTATRVGGVNGVDVAPATCPSLSYDVVLIPNTANSLTTPVLLPKLNPANARVFDNTEDVELTIEGVEGLRMVIRKGSMTLPDGRRPSLLEPPIVALNQVHHDDVPMPLPDGAAPPFACTLQPAGARYDPPVEITYPNMSGLDAGSIAYFLSLNHETFRFEIVATGHVTDDGSSIVSDPGSGITVGGWGCNCPPYSVAGDCGDDDDNDDDNDEPCDESCCFAGTGTNLLVQKTALTRACPGANLCGFTFTPDAATEVLNIVVCPDAGCNNYTFTVTAIRQMESGQCTANYTQVSGGGGAVNSTNFCQFAANFWAGGNGANGGDCFYVGGTLYANGACVTPHENVHVAEFQALLNAETLLLLAKASMQPMPVNEQKCADALAARQAAIQADVAKAYMDANIKWIAQGHSTGAPYAAEYPCARDSARAVCLWAQNDPATDVDTCPTCTSGDLGVTYTD